MRFGPMRSSALMPMPRICWNVSISGTPMAHISGLYQVKTKWAPSFQSPANESMTCLEEHQPVAQSWGLPAVFKVWAAIHEVWGSRHANIR